MKSIQYLMLAFVLSLTSCQKSGSSDDAEEYTDPLVGTFTTGTDTLLIQTHSDVLNNRKIDFNLAGVSENGQKTVFNIASGVEYSEESEHFRQKEDIIGEDSYVAYSSLDFIYNYASDSWAVIDSLVITDTTYNYQSPIVNLSGVYTRVNQE